jgi:hypothetical protein
MRALDADAVSQVRVLGEELGPGAPEARRDLGMDVKIREVEDDVDLAGGEMALEVRFVLAEPGEDVVVAVDGPVRDDDEHVVCRLVREIQLSNQ